MFAWFFRRRYLRFTRHVAGAIRRRLVRGAVLLALLFAAHAGAMMAAEGLDLPDALWLTITTATTVGYGDLSREDAGRPPRHLAVPVLASASSSSPRSPPTSSTTAPWKRERRRRGEFKWKHMKDHLLIVNVPANDTETYLSRLVSPDPPHAVARRPAGAATDPPVIPTGCPPASSRRGSRTTTRSPKAPKASKQ